MSEGIFMFLWYVLCIGEIVTALTKVSLKAEVRSLFLVSFGQKSIITVQHIMIQVVWKKVPHRCSNSPLFWQLTVPPACCGLYWDAPILQIPNCSLPPPFLSRWTWTESDVCSFRLFEWLHDFHLLAQTNPNPYPNLNQFLPNPNLNLTSIRTLPLNLVPHCCSAGPVVHLTTCRPYSELSEQWAGPWKNTTLLHLSLALYLDCHSLFSADHGNFSEHVFLFAALHCAS